jgi:tetratricopeptide (TPR) repeat protein
MRRLGWVWAMLLAAVGSGWAGDAQWVEVKSPHFSVVTDAGEKRGREVAVRFEQMRAVFGTLLVKTNVNLPVPLQIIAFRGTKEMRQFAPLFRGKPIEVAGLFQFSDDRSFILLDMSTVDPWRVVFHEYAHQLLNGNTSGQLQPWFDEGFAEYFSTIKVAGKDADVGLPPEGDVEILRQISWLKISDLFQVQQNSSTYNESGDHRSAFYAESWLVMHFLYDRQILAKCAQYFDLAVDKKVPVAQAVQQAFGMTPEAWDKQLRQYFTSGTVKYYKLPTLPGIETTGYTTTALSFADAKAVLADMHLHSPDYQEKAIEEFQDVLTLDPNNVAALRGLGYAYLGKQNFNTAADYFQKASALNSKDPRVLYYSAVLRNKEMVNTDPHQLETTQKELESSIALDPNFADAYSLLAFVFQSQGKYSEATQAMLHAVAINPRNDNYQYNLSQIYLASQNVEAAVPILGRLKSSTSNPQIAMMASTSLVQVEAYKNAMKSQGTEGQPMALRLRSESSAPPEEEPEAHPPAHVTPAEFLKGKVIAVDCSSPPSAVLTVSVGNKTWQMRTQNRDHLILIGADQWSCEWRNRNVAVNYRQSGEQQGDIISLELQ